MHPQSKLWCLENFGMLKGLSKEEKEKLDTMADMRHAPKKQSLYFPTESSTNIYMLKAGKVKISPYLTRRERNHSGHFRSG